MQEDLISSIYEAGALPGLWPGLLEKLARAFNTRGALVMVRSDSGLATIQSPKVASIMAEYVAEGWADDPTRIAPLLGTHSGGFSTDLDHHGTIDRLKQLPVYADFLIPRGLAFGAATTVQGAANEAIIFTMEGFSSPSAAKMAIPALDRIRPHLARSVTLSARMRQEHDHGILAGLAVAGIGAALLDQRGRVRRVNAGFERHMPGLFRDQPSRLVLADGYADKVFRTILAQSGDLKPDGASIVLRRPETSPMVLHVVPLRRSARDVFDTEGLLLLLSDGTNRNLPNADLIQAMFDLTMAEARVARALMTGRTLDEAARDGRVSVGTVRTQLKSIFGKTGTSRQVDLVQLFNNHAIMSATDGSQI